MERECEMDLVEAAARLRIPWHKAHRWVLIGKLKGERRDGRWKVDAADLERLVAEHTTVPASTQEA